LNEANEKAYETIKEIEQNNIQKCEEINDVE